MKHVKIKNIITIAAIVAVLGMAVGVTAAGVEVNGTFWALVPPIIAIGLALITKEVYSSLFLGITVGAIFACGGKVTTAVDPDLSPPSAAPPVSSCSWWCWASSWR